MKRRISVIMAAIMAGSTICGCGIFAGAESESTTEYFAEMPDTGAQEAGPATENTYSGAGEAESGAYYSEAAPEAGAAHDYEAADEAADEAACEAAQEYLPMNDTAALAGGAEAFKSYDGSFAVRGVEAYDDGFYGPEEYYIPEDEFNTEEYSYNEENPWLSASTSPFSTFAADVDTASYANLRRMILGGDRVPADAVRIEEMINYFSYDYPEPKAGEPFSVTTQIAPCPWNSETSLFMVGLKARDIDMRERMPSNLVFLVDVSGSMDEYDKLPLVQRSFSLLTRELESYDRVSIVTYASGDEVVLEGASGKEKAKICAAMEDLFAGGGTNGSAGIQTAYELAERYFIKGGNNRVILATDGDLNIGLTDEGSLTRLIKEKAASGVCLSVLGFGTGNISDTNMEALADNGNGNYSYIDSIQEARRVLIDEMGGTLYTVAGDVKLQVEFNPEYVKGYRLIGYENRTMAAESFADDRKDGGEIGAGHCVTALYEIASTGSAQEVASVESKYQKNPGKDGDFYGGNGEFMTVNIRYKEPGEDTSTLLSYPVTRSSASRQMSDELSWAAGVAQAGMLLKGSEYAGNSDMRQVLERLERIDGYRDDDYRREFLYLCTRMDV